MLKRGPRDAEVELSRCLPASGPRACELSLVSLSPKKIFAIALCCAGLYAAVLGGMAIAQDPRGHLHGDPGGLANPGGAGVHAHPDPLGTDARRRPRPRRRPRRRRPPRPPRRRSAPRPSRRRRPPRPTPRPCRPSSAAPRRAPRPRPARWASISRARARSNKRRNGHSGNGAILDEGCLDGDAKKHSKKKRGELVGSVVDSTSTTASECDLLNSNAPDDVLGGDTPRATERAGRHPDPGEPRLLGRDPRRGPDRRPELLHRQVPHPALPPPHLPGRRHRVRRALGGARGDQRDRDRLRPQPQRLLRRRARLDAVHARDLEAVRRRRQPRRRRRTPSTRSTRSSRPRATCAPRAPTPTSAGRSSPTTTPTGTSTPCSCAPA